MKTIHAYRPMTREMRPQDPQMDGTGLTFRTLEHGGEYPDFMPQAIELIDAEGRSCTYLPATEEGKVVKSLGFAFMGEGDEGWMLELLLAEKRNRPKE